MSCLQIFINNKAVTLSSNDVRIEGGYVHGINVTLDPVLNKCDQLDANGHQIKKCCAGYFGPDCKGCNI